MNKLIIITGPTASGKTKTSIAIAKMIENDFKKNAAIVNFDSLLFYKEISIGTAKPDLHERAGIEHHLIDIASIASPMNAAEFIALGQNKIEELFAQNKTVILVGGSAFYLRALLKGMYQSAKVSVEIKQKLDSWFKNDGIKPFLDFLAIHDPQSLDNLHVNDHYRLIRAVEHFEVTGTKISEQKKVLDELDPYDFSQIIHPWNILHLYLDLPKEEHFQIILSRARDMFEKGLIEEIKQLQKLGFTLNEKPLSSIGYKEALEHIRGAIPTLEQCIERTAISTRQLAKSQRTFFNKITPKESFNPLRDQDSILRKAALFLGNSYEP